jgi:hypothetical protein
VRCSEENLSTKSICGEKTDNGLPTELLFLVPHRLSVAVEITFWPWVSALNLCRVRGTRLMSRSPWACVLPSHLHKCFPLKAETLGTPCSHVLIPIQPACVLTERLQHGRPQPWVGPWGEPFLWLFTSPWASTHLVQGCIILVGFHAPMFYSVFAPSQQKLSPLGRLSATVARLKPPHRCPAFSTALSSSLQCISQSTADKSPRWETCAQECPPDPNANLLTLGPLVLPHEGNPGPTQLYTRAPNPETKWTEESHSREVKEVGRGLYSFMAR